MKKVILFFLITIFLATGTAHAAKVDINKADAQTLQENLEGVGEVKARAIVNYRRKHGSFKSLDDLMNVPGIGEATIQKNRRNLSLKGGLSKTSKKTTDKAAAKKKVKKEKTASKKTGKSTKLSQKPDKKTKTKKSAKDDKK